MTEGMHFDTPSHSNAANRPVPSVTASPRGMMPSAIVSQCMEWSLESDQKAGSFVLYLDAQAIKGVGPEQTTCVVTFGVDIPEA